MGSEQGFYKSGALPGAKEFLSREETETPDAV